MIKLITQTTEYYCTTNEEAEQVLTERKAESLGNIVKHTIEDKNEYVKLVVKEEYNRVVDLLKDDTQDSNEYYEMFDADNLIIERTDA